MEMLSSDPEAVSSRGINSGVWVSYHGCDAIPVGDATTGTRYVGWSDLEVPSSSYASFEAVHFYNASLSMILVEDPDELNTLVRTTSVDTMSFQNETIASCKTWARAVMGYLKWDSPTDTPVLYVGTRDQLGVENSAVTGLTFSENSGESTLSLVLCEKVGDEDSSGVVVDLLVFLVGFCVILSVLIDVVVAVNLIRSCQKCNCCKVAYCCSSDSIQNFVQLGLSLIQVAAVLVVWAVFRYGYPSMNKFRNLIFLTIELFIFILSASLTICCGCLHPPAEFDEVLVCNVILTTAASFEQVILLVVTVVMDVAPQRDFLLTLILFISLVLLVDNSIIDIFVTLVQRSVEEEGGGDAEMGSRASRRMSSAIKPMKLGHVDCFNTCIIYGAVISGVAVALVMLAGLVIGIISVYEMGDTENKYALNSAFFSENNVRLFGHVLVLLFVSLFHLIISCGQQTLDHSVLSNLTGTRGAPAGSMCNSCSCCCMVVAIVSSFFMEFIFLVSGTGPLGYYHTPLFWVIYLLVILILAPFFVVVWGIFLLLIACVCYFVGACRGD